ncbi:Conserved_hypothetical protein [Hexamita inflata]|uniref:Uncharacterized protein n=1 Tax=Hexamita inflata TaxID=28002 RepID=A0ABP1LVD5_9EUKA
MYTQQTLQKQYNDNIITYVFLYFSFSNLFLQQSYITHQNSKQVTFVQTAILLVIYISSGFLAPIILEYIKMQGAAQGSSLLYAMPNSISMIFVLFVSQKESKILFLKKFWWQVILMSLIDVIGTTLTLFGQILCGSGVYIIIYSSLTAWSVQCRFSGYYWESYNACRNNFQFLCVLAK